MLGPVSEVERFWARFLAETGGLDGPYRVGGFAEEYPEVATELGLLVRDGPKRATAGLLVEYEEAGDPLPMVGERWVITDGAGSPLCVTRTTWVEVRRYDAVDDAFARDEGENDRTLAGWRHAHEWYFGSIGRPVKDDTLLVLERFEKLWP
jgi:uncharacterized protein YhfF